MSLLVFGKTGQVARELQRRAPGAIFLGRDEADLSDPERRRRLEADLSAVLSEPVLRHLPRLRIGDLFDTA